MKVAAALFAVGLSVAYGLPAPERPVETAAADSLSAETWFNQGNRFREQYLRERTMSDAGRLPRQAPSEQLALDSYSAAIRARPDLAVAYVNRAAVHYEMGNYAAAIADCDAAIRIDPTLAEAFNNRSLAYYKLDRYAEAKADFDRTIQLHQFYGNAMTVRVLPDIEPAGAAPD